MKATRKRVTLNEMVSEGKAALRDRLVVRPQAWLEQARERMRDLPKTNFDLANSFAEQGKWFDAMFRYRVVLFLQPQYPKAWHNLGCCYLRLGKRPQAKTAFLHALKQNAMDADAAYMLATIDPASRPANLRPVRMPKTMVVGFFSSIAEGYDLTEANNKYQAGKVVHDLVQPLVASPAPAVLDLGCGTGIVSRPWRAAARSLVGVDITPAMLEMAEKATHAEKKLFDRLLTADIVSLPAETALLAADVVLLVNVAPFVGDLSGVIQGAAKAMGSEGVLAITIEPYTGSAGFGLSAQTGRFGHSNAYVAQLAIASGLKLIKESSVMLYADIPAQALVFGKGTH